MKCVSNRLRWALVGLGAIAALSMAWPRPRRDPWPPRLVISKPAGSLLLGQSVDGWSFGGTLDQGKTVVAWDQTTGRRRSDLPAAWVELRSFAPDRRTFAGLITRNFAHVALAVGDSATDAIRLRIPLRAQSAERVDLVDAGRKVRAVLFDHASRTRQVVTSDRSSGAVESTRTVRGPGPSPGWWSPVFAPDGRTWAYLGHALHAVQFWDGETDQPIGWILSGPTAPPPGPTTTWAAATFTPDGRTLLAGRSDGQGESWDVAGLRRIKTVRLHPADHTIYSIDVSPNGRTLASTGVGRPPDTRLGRLWEGIRIRVTGHGGFGDVQEVALTDRATDRVVARLPACNFRDFAPDGRSFTTCEMGGTLSVRAFPVPTNLTPEGPR